MKAKELMIGDWVDIISTHEMPCEPMKVTDIVEEENWEAIGGIGHAAYHTELTPDEISPIELTEHICWLNADGETNILEPQYTKGYWENGWSITAHKEYKKIRAVSFHDDSGNTITLTPINEEGEMIDFKGDSVKPSVFVVEEMQRIPIEYVHELQHILRVFEMPEKADNFEIEQ